MRVCMISLDAVAQPDADRLFALPALSKHVKMCYNALIPQEKSAKECI